MKLSELLRGVADADDREIGEVRDDSRKVERGDLFVAVRGQTVDGHRYVNDVRARGVAAVVVEEADYDDAIVVPSTARALGLIAANRYGRPADAMRMLGVTGTNGKTTTTYLVESILNEAQRRTGLIGTVAWRSPAGSKPASFTTPTPLVLHETLAEMRDARCTDVVMECSSHALALHRLEGVTFAVAGFTNLTQDHLDLHGTMEAYAAEKAKLFSEHLRGTAVVCIDGYPMRVPGMMTVSTKGHADVVVRDVGTIECDTPIGTLRFSTPLVGAFHRENLAVAIGMAIAAGVSGETIERALSHATGAPGRLERVGAFCYVDYAHTPDALERALAALRPITRGTLWVVFGCGGDRDRGKRPLMGRIAVDGADRVIVTSDNPRSEDPRAIIDQIAAGLDVAIIEDRRTAIETAVRSASPEDVILIAGKGHEDYQIIGTQRLHFDDREEVRKALQRR